MGGAVLFCVALATSTAASYGVARWLRSAGFVDRPGLGRIHLTITPRGGGVAVAVGFLAALIVGQTVQRLGVDRDTQGPLAVSVGTATAAAIGLLDDRLGLSIPTQAVLVASLGLLAAAQGVVLESAHGDELRIVGYLPLAVLETVTVLGLTVTSVNLLDGIDGLSSSVVAGAALGLALLGMRYAPPNSSQLVVGSLSLAGATVGFLLLNWPPARIHTGTAGVFAMSYALVALAATAQMSDAMLVLLAAPLSETVWTIPRRLAARRRFTSRDLGHLHHLMQLRFGPSGALVFYLAESGLLLTALLVTPRGDWWGLLAVGIAVNGIGLVALRRYELPIR